MTDEIFPVLDWARLVEEAIARRKAENLTQRTLAKLAGVSAPTVVKFESGNTEIKLTGVLAILRVLGLAL
ncbi:MAG: helix-turn-helix domain-containing protein [Rhodospirillales bacterium]|nr:helix-turn-helix domain-containing protein [Rhodospirillales bacterium]MCB9995407.1 helix-turn-helix domain-containing protein [Rhodospirillales bacterium]